MSVSSRAKCSGVISRMVAASAPDPNFLRQASAEQKVMERLGFYSVPASIAYLGHNKLKGAKPPNPLRIAAPAAPIPHIPPLR